jgi:aryl-alcohol dehydrogenase-like predicted oxidoreductase
MLAWQFQALQNVAKEHGWHQFISMQNYYSPIYREEEREMIPYCRYAGVGMIPYSPLARGYLARPYRSEPTTRTETDHYVEILIGKTRDSDVDIINRVEELANKKGVSMATITLAWHLKKGLNPIVGVSSIARLDDAIKAIEFASSGKLTDDDIKYLDENYLPKGIPSLG